MQINTIYNEDCLQTMARMPDNYIDLVVTSPHYDNLRSYNGYTFDFPAIAKELFRVIKGGGVVVWVVGDQTIKGSESGTSFRQALYFKEIGFNLHDTMIYQKGGCNFPDTNRYYQGFEYMFVFTKGKIKTYNLISDRENKSFGRKVSGTCRQKDGTTTKKVCDGNNIKQYGIRFNVWLITEGKRQTEHPATFPEKLAHDHIISWSNTGDLVYDPICGSGTTCREAKKLNRNFIGSEISAEYCQVANKLLGECNVSQTQILL